MGVLHGSDIGERNESADFFELALQRLLHSGISEGRRLVTEKGFQAVRQADRAGGKEGVGQLEGGYECGGVHTLWAAFGQERRSYRIVN